jgi:hypothetical protein
MLYAYLGPDTFLPLTSILATVVGGALMFGRVILQAFRVGLSRLTGKSSDGAPAAAKSRSELLGRAGAADRPATPGPHVRPGATRKEPQP